MEPVVEPVGARVGDAVVLAWQQPGGDQRFPANPAARRRSVPNTWALGSICIAAMAITVAAVMVAWLGAGHDPDEQLAVPPPTRLQAPSVAELRSPAIRADASLQPALEPVTPDVAPARNVTTRRLEPAGVSMIQTGSLPALIVPAARPLDTALAAEPASPEAAIDPPAEPPPPRRGTVARKVVGGSASARARASKWTATFFNK